MGNIREISLEMVLFAGYLVRNSRLVTLVESSQEHKEGLQTHLESLC
jgi:hypothetical protein